MSKSNKNFFADKDIQIILGTLLRVGVIASMSVVLIGGLIYLFFNHNQVVDYKEFNPGRSGYSSIAAILHGFPGDYVIQEGDLISVDCGVIKNDFFGDSAYTFSIGEIDSERQKLVEVTQECLKLAIEKAVVGSRIGDVGFAVQAYAEANGFGVVRELVGHGQVLSLWL